MVTKHSFPISVIVVKEKVGRKNVFVASTPVFDIASQGETVEKAMDELKEAVELFLEEPGVPIHLNVNEVFTSTTTVNLPVELSCKRENPVTCS